MKGIIVTKNIKEVRIQGIWGELEPKNFSRVSLHNFLLLFISLLTNQLNWSKNVKWLEISLPFYKIVITQT